MLSLMSLYPELAQTSGSGHEDMWWKRPEIGSGSVSRRTRHRPSNIGRHRGGRAGSWWQKDFEKDKRMERAEYKKEQIEARRQHIAEYGRSTYPSQKERKVAAKMKKVDTQCPFSYNNKKRGRTARRSGKVCRR